MLKLLQSGWHKHERFTSSCVTSYACPFRRLNIIKTVQVGETVQIWQSLKCYCVNVFVKICLCVIGTLNWIRTTIYFCCPQNLVKKDILIIKTLKDWKPGLKIKFVIYCTESSLSTVEVMTDFYAWCDHGPFGVLLLTFFQWITTSNIIASK